MNPWKVLLGIVLLAAAAVVAGAGTLQLEPPIPGASVKYLELSFAPRALPDTVAGTTTEGGNSNIVLDVHAWASTSGTLPVGGSMSCTGEPTLQVGVDHLALTTSPAWFRLRMSRTGIAEGTSCTFTLDNDGFATVWWDALILWGYPPDPAGAPPSEDVTPSPPGSSTQTGSPTTLPPPTVLVPGPDVLGMAAIAAVVLLVIGGVIVLAAGVIE